MSYHTHTCPNCKQNHRCNLRMCELFKPICDSCQVWLQILEELRFIENKLKSISNG